VRRLVALFVLALLGATLYGLSNSSSGIDVNHQSVSANTFRTELNAIAHNETLQCFLSALDPTDYALGAGGGTIKAAGAAAWANLRVEGLAVNQYVTDDEHYVPDSAQLAAAKTSLEQEMTEAATQNSYTCPGTSAQAVAAMPAEMQKAEIQAQATSLYLVGKLKASIPLTLASMQTYYKAHTSYYDTLCISVALVTPADVASFNKAAAAGETVAELAKQYSQDPSAAKGGAYGCVAPSDSSYASVRADIGTLALNTFSTSPQYITYNSEDYALYVAVTKRTTTPFASAESTVLSDLRNLNAASAGTVKNDLLYKAAVHVDPAFGQWGLTSTGLDVVAPALPAASDVTGTKPLTGTAATYK
jgi:hypothetical protein